MENSSIRRCLGSFYLEQFDRLFKLTLIDKIHLYKAIIGAIWTHRLHLLGTAKRMQGLHNKSLLTQTTVLTCVTKMASLHVRPKHIIRNKELIQQLYQKIHYKLQKPTRTNSKFLCCYCKGAFKIKLKTKKIFVEPKGVVL